MMNHSVRLLFAFLCLGLASAFSQVELVDNTWPTDPQGYNFYPDAFVAFQSRIFRTPSGVGIPGIPWKFTVKQYGGQGFHTHETANGTVVTRPNAVFVSGNGTGVTGADGTATVDLEFNGYAGWYTICTKFGDPNDVRIVLAERCVNINTRYTTGGFNGSGRIPLVRYTGGLQPFASNEVNQPQTLHWDSRHVSANSSTQPGGGPVGSQNVDGYTTRWVTATAGAQLFAASSLYKDTTYNDGLPDLLDVTRASLPDGGAYDNDVAGVAPGAGGPVLDWDTRVNEEHSRGVEVDITIPSYPSRQTREFEALYFSGCKPGINEPYGARISFNPPDPFWKTQGVVHVSCSNGLATGLKGGHSGGR